MTGGRLSKTATLYARVSSAEQARPDATSVEQQLDRGASYADAMGWEVVERVRDDGITGSTSLAERPEGRRLLATDSEVVIFWSMDRFTRSASKGLADIEALEERGVSLVFVKEAIDTSTPSGRLFRTMLAAFAEFEREQIRDRNMSGRFGAAEKGRWAGGQLPFGYTLDEDGAIVIDPEEAEVIRKVFSLRVEGRSMPDIARHLNQRTQMTPRDRYDRRTGRKTLARFSPGSVRSYLLQTAYKGEPIVRDIAPAKGAEPRSFSYPAPVIIDPVEWERAQGSLVGRRIPDGAGEHRHTYGLSGRVKHAHPDLHTPPGFYGFVRGGRFYRCDAARSKPGRPANCPGIGLTRNRRKATAIDADWVEGSVLLWVLDNLGTPAMEVEGTGERDPAADENPPRGSGEWRGRLREEALAGAARTGPLSPWAVGELAHLADALDITAVLSEGDDYKHPTITLEVGNEEVHSRLGDWTLRWKLPSRPGVGE